jgi:hypothetical protein
MMDGPEHPINHAKGKADRKMYYSGKKKAHTVKSNVISERSGQVLFLSDTHEAKKHDGAYTTVGGSPLPPLKRGV